MGYQLLGHTADVAVEGWGDHLGDAFAAVADGMAAAMCDRIPDTGERFALEVAAESVEAALFDYLDELIYQRDVRDVLPAENRASVERRGDQWVVEASARGVPLGAVEAREIKAVTYSDMAIEEVEGEWLAYVVLDV